MKRLSASPARAPIGLRPRKNALALASVLALQGALIPLAAHADDAPVQPKISELPLMSSAGGGAANVLLILDNSGSMDFTPSSEVSWSGADSDDPNCSLLSGVLPTTGAVAGDGYRYCASKSHIARSAARDFVTNYGGKFSIGLMAYQQLDGNYLVMYEQQFVNAVLDPANKNLGQSRVKINQRRPGDVPLYSSMGYADYIHYISFNYPAGGNPSPYFGERLGDVFYYYNPTINNPPGYWDGTMTSVPVTGTYQISSVTTSSDTPPGTSPTPVCTPSTMFQSPPGPVFPPNYTGRALCWGLTGCGESGCSGGGGQTSPGRWIVTDVYAYGWANSADSIDNPYYSPYTAKSMYGYLHIPIAPATSGSTQYNNIIAKLNDQNFTTYNTFLAKAGSGFGYPNANDFVNYLSNGAGSWATTDIYTNPPVWKNPDYPLSNVGNTPMAGTVMTANAYFNGGTAQPANSKPFDQDQGGPAPAPAMSACTKNYAVFLTDGLASTSPANNGHVWGSLGTNEQDSADAEVVSALKNLLQSDAQVQTYFIGFGSDAAGSSSLNQYAAAGGTVTPYSAMDSASLKNAFDAIGNSIQSTISAAVSAVATNSTQLTSDTNVYQGIYDPAGWGGHLKAYHINPDTGAADGAATWDAAAHLPTGSSRNVFTMLPKSGHGAPFTADGIAPDDSVKTWLLTRYMTGEANFYGDGGTNVSLMINFLKGDQSHETPNGSGNDTYRARSNLLGDIVDSAAVYVGKPDRGYPASLEPAAYSAFVADNASRAPMLYVGANDGMLHAFAADSGTEMFAYIPASVLPALSYLADPTYSHRFYVDGTPTVSDAYLGGQWRTVLVGGLNAGGQGIYALDVTNPAALDESSVLWEFTDRQTLSPAPAPGAPPKFDADLGDTFSQPAIARVRATTPSGGHWVAIFGNGYGNTADDGSPSATGNAVLYVVDLQTGQLIKKFDTGYGWQQAADHKPNGLSSPTPADVNGDVNAEYVYAGDLQGHLWKFDISSDNTGEWQVAFSGAPVLSGAGDTTASCSALCTPLYTARAGDNSVQAITEKPEVGSGPAYYGGQMVYFGTGKSFEEGDNALTTPNTFYGIWDNNTAVTAAPNRTALQEQKIDLITDVVNGFHYRLTTRNAIDWESQRGWFMDLPETGERSTSNPQLNSGRLIFVTNTPTTSTDQCTVSGSSWLMDIDPLTGAPLPDSPFDVNGDGVFNGDDQFDHHGGNQSASGQQEAGGGGMLSAPQILNGNGFQAKVFSSSTGDLITRKEKGGTGNQRQLWRDLSAQQ